MDVVYDIDENDEKKMDRIRDVIPIILELIQLKCTILKFHLKTKKMMALRLLHLESVAKKFMNQGNYSTHVKAMVGSCPYVFQVCWTL